ncbi:solute carrier family 13 member 5 isoform X2 [Lingula anatina]|nr:solute carrier family 13 member 5 isoform X2 [Lingula anatina]|eukprot:XP_013410629.1 solute carrier family 13 member 5 isoform X2 [Lingula anatina]
MLFVGGLMVAVAVEHWNLHKRIALRVLLLVGSKPKWLMFGFMIVTAFLSMWISNTATTAMMIPIVQAVLSEIKYAYAAQKFNQEVGVEEEELEPFPVENGSNTLELENDSSAQAVSSRRRLMMTQVSTVSQSRDPQFKSMCKGLSLCIAYAANIGGIATLTGTGPNLVFKGNVDSRFGAGAGINFSSWFVFAFPLMVITLLAAWVWLQLLFLGWRTLFGICSRKPEYGDAGDAAKNVIRKEYEKLGKMTFAEIAVLCHFTLLALLWLTREPEFIDGWDVIFEDGYVTDAVTAMVIVMSLFVFPSQWPKVLCWKTKDVGPVPPLLDWMTVQRKLAWNVVILLGGGFAMADACQQSGLSDWLGEQMSLLKDVPVWCLVLILTFTIASFTEFSSNVATATIFLPILAGLAKTLSVNPLYLMMPVTVSCSFAFMLPVATPPNAIVFSYGHLQVKDMAKAGVVMNLICIAFVNLAINTWGKAYFNLGTFPSWGGGANMTSGGEILNSSVTISPTGSTQTFLTNYTGI